MGKFTSTGPEKASKVLTGTLTANGQQSSTIDLFGEFNASIWGTFSATAQIERSFDGGTTWLACSLDATGTAAAYTAAASVLMREPEPGVLYRLNCTAFVSGTINYRLSQI